ncbi:uncharacterized protein N7473_004020 [Penicillium subrubescens]|uniref:uncharacterized protein n=1 Tax=Penicillium subrubescens TaxID=1316194 RepID=UPI00254534D6|nr:uncharacterized protein N7473_004020 [Penicillium subrubescens]KAJ5907104.1 hypothetical protein N7473_004020 [Penicillium subrubescens]
MIIQITNGFRRTFTASHLTIGSCRRTGTLVTEKFFSFKYEMHRTSPIQISFFEPLLQHYQGQLVDNYRGPDNNDIDKVDSPNRNVHSSIEHLL